MSSPLHGIAIARAAVLSAGLLLGAASGAFAANGYFDTAGAPLVAPTLYSTGNGAATVTRQQQSGYFADAGAALVTPITRQGDAAATRALQRASGYFADAGAPLVAPTLDRH